MPHHPPCQLPAQDRQTLGTRRLEELGEGVRVRRQGTGHVEPGQQSLLGPGQVTQELLASMERITRAAPMTLEVEIRG